MCAGYVEDTKAAELMACIAEMEDVAARHMAADELLCTLLVAGGYIATVEEFKEMGKWYS